MSFRNKLVAAFGLALAILIGVGVLSYLKVRQDSDDQAWVEHTHATLEKLDAFQTDFAGAGTGQRSYIVTGEKAYLDEYEDFVRRTDEESAQLKQLTADNPVQQRSLNKLLPLVSARLADMQRRIETFQREGPPPRPRPATPAAGGPIRETMEQIQSVLSDMKQEEQHLLKTRLNSAAASGREFKGVFVFGNFLAFLFLLGAGIIVHREMTKRAHAEETLRRSEERFRLMISGVKDYSFLMLDPQGRIASWNAGAERMKRYQAAEILGRHFSCFYPTEYGEKPSQEIEIAMKQGWSEDEGWRVRKDGSRFWANVTITALRDGSGQLRGFGKVTRDMTERRRAEKEMEIRSAQLEAANKELESFSYSVSHDLRAPLRSIDGFSQALLEDHFDRLDASAKQYLQRVRAAAQRMSSLIDDLLGLARITRAEMHHEKIDLSALARSVATDLRVAEPGRKVEFVIAPGLMAEGDARLLRTVLENLLGNSWKFTSRRKAARIEVGRVGTDGIWVFYVRDNGAGFDQKYKGQLFAPFQRLHGTDQFPGSGIGLASAQRIVHRHGGQIWAEGEVDKGAAFYFTLLADPALMEDKEHVLQS